MHDLVIRNGTIVDGTGRTRFVGDVAIDGDRVAAVEEAGTGEGIGPGAREIDAEGHLVTPGWVDIHTHYDGQATWDSIMAPSSIHGVTSVVMGNCGVGFAPTKPGEDDHDFLIGLMEGVEDIPGAALHEGLTWDWQSLPEYFDAVARRDHTIDIGAQVPHASLRAFVMGERGADHEEDPTPAEIAEMARLTAEGLEAGALGFATSRTLNHRTRDGQKIGTLTAETEELIGIAEALRSTGRGVLQFVSDFLDVEAELGVMRAAAEAAGRPVSVSLVQADPWPDRWREVLDWMATATAEGVDMKAQVAARPIGLLIGLHGSMHPFVKTPAYAEIADLPVDEQVRRMGDPDLRRTLIEQAREVRGGLYAFVAKRMDKIFRLGENPDYEPAPDASIEAQAKRLGVEPMELLYDILLERAGEELLYCPAGNYSEYNLDAAREMVLHDRTLFGLSDGGAHCAFICDGSFPTYNLTHWCRDRTRGEQLDLEFVVKGQTLDTASHVGWNDRGVLSPGYLADVNVIDFDQLRLRAPQMINDLPAGGRRLMQEADGYRYTLKRGAVSFENGEHTGELPGQFVRGAQER